MKHKIIGILLFCLLPTAASVSQKPVATTEPKPPFSLEELEKRTFQWFWDLAYAENWQTPDRWPTENFSSIAATGFGLAAYVIGSERGWVTRQQAAERTLRVLEVLKNLPQGNQFSGVAGYRGFFYHFLEVKTALRFKNIELSSIDTGLLMAGVLVAMTYFDQPNSTEKNIRDAADFLYRRVEFDWFLNEKNRLSMGWFPDRGFLESDWRGYNEAMVLLIMAMGSPTHPAPPEMWDSWCEPYYRAPFRGQDMVNFGPLFGHQYSQMFIDFRGIRDKYMAKTGWDYFENSRRATLAQRNYCIENPRKFKGYSENIWGLTACDGPANIEKPAEDPTGGCRKWNFQTYSARGVAADYLVDDGTIAPTAVGGSLPFAPEVCLPALEAMWNRFPVGKYGFFDAYNETFTWQKEWEKGQAGQPFWVDEDYLGIDQGPILIQIENYRSGLIWNILKRNKYIVAGLRAANFTGGWLEKISREKTDQMTPSHLISKKSTNPEIPLEPEGFFRREIFMDKNKTALPYWLMPPQNSRTEKYPLVIFLHGSGERGNLNHEQMKNGVFAFCEKENLQKHPCWLLVPQCPEGNRWSSANWTEQKFEYRTDSATVPGQQVLDLVEKLMVENPSIDPARIYLTGLSMGGFGTFDLLMRRPDLFAAGLPLCGGGDPDFSEKIKDIPIWIFHGRLDASVHSRYSQQMFEALQKVGGKVKYTEFSTLRHFIWDQVYYNPAVLDWLFAQRKT